MLSPSPNSKVPLSLGQESTKEKVYSQLLTKELNHITLLFTTLLLLFVKYVKMAN